MISGPAAGAQARLRQTMHGAPGVKRVPNRLVHKTCGVPNAARDGAIAQLGERLNGIQEVGGSTPPGSTKTPLCNPSQSIADSEKSPEMA